MALKCLLHIFSLPLDLVLSRPPRHPAVCLGASRGTVPGVSSGPLPAEATGSSSNGLEDWYALGVSQSELDRQRLGRKMLALASSVC